MNMPTFALLTRSLRTEARSGWTYISRLVLVLIILYFMLQPSLMGSMMGAPGLVFFHSVVNLDAFFITLAAIGYFATCITEEKEEGTLGLLRMTDLSPVSILLGKFGGRLVAAILLILVQLPFTLLAITLGGIALIQIEAAYLCLLAYTVLAAGAGLFVSVCAPRSRRAFTFTLILVVAYMLANPLGQLFRFILIQSGLLAEHSVADGRLMQILQWVMSANIFMDLDRVLSSGIHSSLLTTGAIVNVIGGAVWFFLAWLCFDLFNRRDITAEPTRPLLLFRTRRRAPRRAWIGARAIVWKDLYFTAGGPMGLIILTTVFALITVLLAYLSASLDPAGLTRQVLAAEMAGVFFWIGVIHVLILANRVFSEEVQGRTLSNLALLPYPMSRIAYAKVAGSLVSLIPVTAFLLVSAALSPTHTLVLLKFLFLNFPGWLILCEGLFLLHLIALLSLYVKWAAIPIALAVNFVVYMVFMMVVGILFVIIRPAHFNDWLMAGIPMVLLLSLAVLLHICIELRLAQLARE